MSSHQGMSDRFPVVPLSVLSNWEQQIQDHIKPGALTYCVYYGTTRNMSAEELKKYDIVITTYQTVAKEHGNAAGKVKIDGEPSKKRKKAESSLFDVKWKVRCLLLQARCSCVNICRSVSFWTKATVYAIRERKWHRRCMNSRLSEDGS